MSIPLLPDAHAAARAAKREILLDWLETQSRVMGFWLDRLIADGDEDEVVSLLHRQQSWLEMMHARLSRSVSSV